MTRRNPYRGAMGGLTPLRSPPRGCTPPPQRDADMLLPLKSCMYDTNRRPTETAEGNRTATPLRLSIFRTFLGELDSRLLELYSHDYLFTWLHVFCSDDALWRNYLIKRVELFEPSSIHGTISRESTFHLYFVKVESGFSRND